MDMADWEARSFDCVIQKARLLPETCAGMWKSAQQLRRDDDRSCVRCVGCPIGARNAGASTADINATRQQQAVISTLVCTRCRNQADKLVKKRLCVSCMNRQYEFEKGKNRRGHAPKHPPAIHTETLAVRARAIEVVQIDKVASFAEAVLVGVRENSAVRLLSVSPGLPVHEGLGVGA